MMTESTAGHDLRTHSQDLPKTFSKDLPMSDD